MSKTLPGSETLTWIEAGAGEPLLLLHGVGMCAEAWGPQIEALSQTHRVIALNMPGHGSSLLPDGALLPDYVAWAARAIDSLGLQKVSVAGHSMGALIALGLAVEHPAKIARVALLNAVHRRDPAARAAVLARAEAIAEGEFDLDTPLNRWFEPGDPARALVAGWLQNVDRKGYAMAYRAFALGDSTHAEGLAKLHCPALFLTADGDPNSTPAMAEAMSKAAPDGRVLVIPGHRHMVSLTAPKAVSAALRDWLKRPAKGQDQMTQDQRRALRDAFGTFMTGVTVVTTMDATGKPVGFTANSFSSVSLDPPLLLVSLAKSSSNYKTFTEGAHFAINILAEDQRDISTTFARPVADRFATVAWHAAPQASPILEGVAAWFDCTTHQVVDAGDHALLIGRIDSFASTAAPGLGYYRGSYFTATAAVRTGPEVVVSAVIEQNGAVLLVDDGLGGLTLPTAKVGAKGASATVCDLIEALGLTAAPGFIYSVFEDVARSHQHIAFHCPCSGGTPTRGAFVELSPASLTDVTDQALRTMLERLSEESAQGNYGIYFGNQTQGRVARVSGETP
ncbi:alpha/beta fold hydrolase [Rhodobacteraceae bacterium CYK-10]|uniref:Alpha/beta fold hydrolase n=2 Tax=Stagnihabitans tardus TaxID=2699202 RepID=A0AAE5BRS2_9RHOB|nr:alpha/beta fold hydrolase [Stagnihabitans tardus]